MQQQKANHYLRIVSWLRTRYAEPDGSIIIQRGKQPSRYKSIELLAYRRYILQEVFVNGF